MIHHALARSIALVISVSFPYGVAAGETLLQVYSDAVENDPEIRSEHALYLAAVERGDGSSGRLYPSVVLSGEIARKREDVVVGAGATGTSGVTYFDNNRLELTVKQALYRKDVFSSIDIDQTNARVAEHEYRAAHQAFILRVVNRYVDILAAANDLHYLQAERKAIRKQLDDTRRRFKAGAGTRADLYEAQATYDLSQAQVIVAETALEDARAALQEITNQNYDELTDIMNDFMPKFDGSTDIEYWLNAAEQHNPELEASRLRVAVLRHELEKAGSGHYPELDIVAKYRVEETGGRFGESDTDDKSVALQLSFPLYEGGQTSAEVREYSNRLFAEKEKHSNTVRNIQRSVSNAFRSVNSSINQIKALKQARTSAASALDAIRAGYNAGTRTTADVLDAQRELFRARRDVMQMEYRFIVSMLELKALAGQLTEEDIKSVNTLFSKS